MSSGVIDTAQLVQLLASGEKCSTKTKIPSDLAPEVATSISAPKRSDAFQTPSRREEDERKPMKRVVVDDDEVAGMHLSSNTTPMIIRTPTASPSAAEREEAHEEMVDEKMMGLWTPKLVSNDVREGEALVPKADESTTKSSCVQRGSRNADAATNCMEGKGANGVSDYAKKTTTKATSATDIPMTTATASPSQQSSSRRRSPRLAPSPTNSSASNSTNNKNNSGSKRKKKSARDFEKRVRNKADQGGREELTSVEWPWEECRVHRPTLAELQNTTFSEYVRKVVLRGACSKGMFDGIDEKDIVHPITNNDSSKQRGRRRRQKQQQPDNNGDGERQRQQQVVVPTLTNVDTPRTQIEHDQDQGQQEGQSAGTEDNVRAEGNESRKNESSSTRDALMAGAEVQSQQGNEHDASSSASAVAGGSAVGVPSTTVGTSVVPEQQQQQQQQQPQVTAAAEGATANGRSNAVTGNSTTSIAGNNNKKKSNNPASVHEKISDFTVERMPLAQGIAKVVLPPGLWKKEHEAHKDRTARTSAAWQKGGRLGDYVIHSPIKQHLRGLAGIYEYTFTDEPPATVAEFRDKADQYRINHVGCAYESDDEDEGSDENSNAMGINNENLRNSTGTETKTEGKVKSQEDKEKKKKDRLAHLERLFWKRLGPTMPPAMYGADQEGSFFDEDVEILSSSSDEDDSDEDDEEAELRRQLKQRRRRRLRDPDVDDACGWSIRHMDTCLHVLSHVPGVTSPYLYFGMFGSVFCCHTEDMNLLSINYLHAGAPKIWYAVAPKDSARLEALATHHYNHAFQKCHEFLRHKRYLLSPKVLKKAGIEFTTTIQYPGEAMITMPYGYHFGFNTGFNVAEATNLAVPEWIPFARKANVCLCRPDSVRIDIDRFITLLNLYDADQKHRRRGARLSWKEWSQKRDEEELERKRQKRRNSAGKSIDPQKKAKLSEQQRRKEFWVEVMKPIGTTSVGGDMSCSKGKKKKGKKLKLVENQQDEELWHLARPIAKKRLRVESKVLVILPATVVRKGRSEEMQLHIDQHDSDKYDVDSAKDEQCFAGQVTEMAENHVRVHLNGLPKTEDVWMPIESSKLFEDGGRWTKDLEKEGLPELHYWQVKDSKELTADDE